MFRLRTLAVALPIVFVAAAPVPPRGVPAPTALAYEFETRSSFAMPGAAPKEQLIMRGHALIGAKDMRVDIDQTAAPGNGPMGAGTYMLSLANGTRNVWVNPSQKQYYESAATPSFSIASSASVARRSRSLASRRRAFSVSRSAPRQSCGFL
jgi:hypothetical protein